jgi:tRNA A37 threonylcarbamoyladenosine dehydratase
MDHERRFSGISRLYGSNGLRNFSSSHVIVVGIGGVGSWAVEALARSGVGQLTLYDLDHVAESNVNRQLPALEEEFGRPKVSVMAERIDGINPQCRVVAVEDFIHQENLSQLVEAGADFILDCVDSYRIKAAMIATCRRNRLPIITLGGAGGQTDPTRVRIADLSRTEQDPLLSKTRKLLRREYGFPSNPKRRFEVPAVYSNEQQRNPTLASTNRLAAGDGSLNCAGYGSVMTVTASFGLAAVAYVLDKLSS